MNTELKVGDRVKVVKRSKLDGHEIGTTGEIKSIEEENGLNYYDVYEDERKDSKIRITLWHLGRELVKEQ